MIVLVCGGRDFSNADAVSRAFSTTCTSVVIEGGARGADTLARNEAVRRGIHVATVPALWDKYGKSAGYKRNAAMLDLKPDLCVAFPGGKGTAMMVKLCQDAGIPVRIINEDGSEGSSP